MKKLVLIVLILAAVYSAQEKRAITIDDLWSMKRIGAFDISPDGKTIAFDLTEYSMETNEGDKDIWLINTDGNNLRVFKNSDKNEGSPKFTPDGRLSYELESQIWVADLDGGNESKLTDLYTGASGVRWSEDGNKFLFTSMVYPECVTQECNESKDKAKEADPVKAKIFTELMYKHWNDWRGDKRSHLFLMDLKKGEYIDLNLSSEFDVPPIALGSSHDYDISPNGKEIAFAMNDADFLATSTNNDIYVINVEDIKKNYETPYKKISVSDGNDNQPVYSPDGKYIAFRSMTRAGFEADKQKLMLYERAAGTIKNISGDLDISIGEIIWSQDSKSVFYNAANEIYKSIYKIDIETGENEIILKERVNTSLTLSADGEKIYFKQQRNNLPYEIFRVNTDGSNLEQITKINSELLSQIEMNDIETFWSDGAEGAQVQSILLKPPFFEPTKKYPMIFLIHGGPQGHWNDDFHYRWNMQMFASRGYVVVAPNPRGSVGYGQQFTDEISKDWGGKVYTDLMNSYDYAIDNFTFIDSKNTFSAGASYGGYMINWIEGHTDRFNALVSHAGVFNLTSMYGATEELWFPEWEFGGPPWESHEIYQKWSPHMYAENFKTPMLVIHGAYDFRVPEGQAFELFTTLQRMEVESKLLYFPDEYHFIVKPLNAKLWWNTVYDWFDHYKVMN